MNFYNRFMAIVDGFRMWLDRLDQELLEQGADRSHADFEAADMFAAYENGTPPKRFSADPTAPYRPPAGKRWLLPAGAAKKPWFALITALVLVASYVCFMELGVGSQLESFQASGRAGDLLGKMRNKHLAKQEWKRLAFAEVQAEMDANHLMVRSGMWEIGTGKVMCWCGFALLFIIAHTYRRLNVRKKKVFEVLYREPPPSRQPVKG